MKYKLFYLIALIIALFGSACKKRILCISNTNGRIIGFDPCRNYYSGRAIYGSGFVIEINNGITNDTVVTYQIPETLFAFQPSDFNGSTPFLFRPEIQDMFKIKLNFKYAADNEKTFVLCAGNIDIADYTRAVKGKEIFINCISSP